MGQVKIGPEFFTKIKNDYADWHWSLVREFLQNCFDAPGCDEVWVGIAYCEGTTTLVVRNNGAAMDRVTLEDKLLTLGGSGKNFDGDCTGGFGVAKSLLYYTHKSYTIRSGGLLVTGQGAGYELSEVETGGGLDGTESVVTMDGDQSVQLRHMVERFAMFSQWKGTLRLNGEVLETNLKKGARRRDLGWATVYSNNSFSNLCVVRINGQPMFTRYCRYKGCVLLELNGKAKDTLTSNRDSLTGQYASELGDLLSAIAVDKRSALREQRAAYKRYLGDKLRAEAAAPKAAGNVSITDLVDVAALASALLGTGQQTEVAPPTAAGGIKLVVEGQQDDVNISIGHEFIIKNTTGMVTPAYYQPGPDFSSYSKGLVRAWATVLVKLYQIFEMSAEFSVGFVLDDENVAEYENGPYGPVYYINPARVVCQRDKPQCRSFKARFTGPWVDRFDLISSAAHEFVHGAFGLKEHDEIYSGKLTEVMAVVVEHAKDLTPLFRS